MYAYVWCVGGISKFVLNLGLGVLIINHDAPEGPTITLERVSQTVVVKSKRPSGGNKKSSVLSNAQVRNG